MRVLNCLIAMGGVWIGAVLLWSENASIPVLLASLATFMLCGAGNLMNDLVDFESDRVSHPNRAIVSGRLPRPIARNVGIASALCSLLIAGVVGWAVLGVAAAAAALLALYNLQFQRYPLVGNALVALLAALTLFTGAIATGRELSIVLAVGLPPAWFAFVIHFMREIVKDIQDEAGDRLVGHRSFPIVRGKQAALRLVAFCGVMLAASTIVPFASGMYPSFSYLAVIIFLVDLPMFLLLVSALRKPESKQVDQLATGLKVIMLTGMLALFFT